MIRYLVFKPYADTLRYALRLHAKELAGVLKPFYYEDLWRMTRIPVGPYIFSDMERMDHSQMEMAARAWEMLSKSVPKPLLLNHPTRSMRRYELLRYCHESGINRFNVYRLTEWRKPTRFPVFIRDENLHGELYSDLLYNTEALQKAVEDALRDGHNREKWMIVEYCDIRDKDGLFRKYSCFVVGDEIIPRHLFFSEEWIVKMSSVKKMATETLDEEMDFVRQNPHKEILQKIFRDARIEYGRVDYGMLEDVPQIWEINTNPTLISDPGSPSNRERKEVNVHFMERYVSAIKKLDPAARPRQHVKINPSRLRRWAKKLPQPVKDGLKRRFPRLKPAAHV
jgi:hypothetical protein